MARLIDADYLLEALSHLINGNRHFVNGIRAAEELVKNAPTVDAEPIRHGHWIDKGKYWYVCSVCDYVEPLSDLMDAHYKYCPNCGAKMDEVEEK